MKEGLKLSDNEMYQLSLALLSYLLDRDTYFTKKSARIYNNLLNKVRKNAIGRVNIKSILAALGDDV